MSEETKQEETEQEEVEVVEAPPLFTVKNVVRRVQTRLLRAKVPGRRRFKQWVNGRRLLRNQSVKLTPEQMAANEKNITRGMMEGALEVTDPDGWRCFVDAQGRMCRSRGNEHEVQGVPKLPASPPADDKTEEIEDENIVDVTEVVEDEIPEGESSEDGSDDLTVLEGIGKGRAKRLEEAGISSYDQVSEMTVEAMTEMMGSSFGEEASFAVIAQAAELAEGGE